MIAQVIEGYITQDPGLPRQNPTSSYWQHIPHKLADTKSPSLPLTTDVAVIGSGITGVSVTKTLLDNHEDLKVVVFEARSLCSGATGRNGGQLATNAGEIYAEYKERFGSDLAGEIASFTFKTCERMKEVIAEYAPEESEYRDVTKVRTFLDEETFSAMKSSIHQMEEDHPHLRGIYNIVDKETVLKEHGVHGATGGVTLPAGVLWPYRVVTKVFEALLAKYPDRLNIETNTPVTSIECVDGAYIIKTPRGQTQARHVIHCTNGYASHLIPQLRGLLFPLRGTMTVQDLGPGVPNNGAKDSFAFHYVPEFDEETETLADGLWYLTQNAKSGYYFIGGEKATMEQNLTADDTAFSEVCVDHLQKILPKFFNYTDVKKDPLISAWSGIMGFTQDGAPYVGRLPSETTGRSGTNEWIASGFNGYGMPYCWLAGEAVAKLVLEQKIGDGLPKAFWVSDERLLPERITKMAEAIASLSLPPPENLKSKVFYDDQGEKPCGTSQICCGPRTCWKQIFGC
ncbi:FAD dependent oxidoreductase [Fusarium austroafricanum]|uniref:FAD dependent oxidoreductase n=1 Tax=Fusarium austroafricanum TaxID=2364996 RepID=A0A8H4KHZ1_9HYPO|nr:FAD dependent oxidoreductase [Fusarium austroafricanum]